MCNHSHEQGSSGGELALFVRLYVLEAVCAYHKGDIFGTAKCLDKVQFVICNLVTSILVHCSCIIPPFRCLCPLEN